MTNMTSEKNREITILLAEDDDGHASLILEMLREAGLKNEIVRFRDGQELLDFLVEPASGAVRQEDRAYLVLLDIRMPRKDGVQTLSEIKRNEGLRNLPVVMLTTTDDPREIQACYDLGCNCYVTKPVEFEAFASTLRSLGLFLIVVCAPLLRKPEL